MKTEGPQLSESDIEKRKEGARRVRFRGITERDKIKVDSYFRKATLSVKRPLRRYSSDLVRRVTRDADDDLNAASALCCAAERVQMLIHTCAPQPPLKMWPGDVV